MAGKSRYDELHDKYKSIMSTKKGTRYERLAAVVFSALDRKHITIHDLKVFGKESGAAHQIDVHIECNGHPKRILIECKDFDVSGASVGLPVVRNFWGVVDDVHPDEAWIITCNGFTRDARKFAKAKGIRLATLRLFAESDWDNRIRTIVTTISVINVGRDRPDMRIQMDDANAERFKTDLAAAYPLGVNEHNDRTELFDGELIRSWSQMSKQLGDAFDAASDEKEVVEAKVCDGWVSASGGERFTIMGYRLALPVSRVSVQMTITVNVAGALPALVLNDEDGVDFILWDDTLRAYQIDENGRIHLADEAIQSRVVTTFASVATA